MKKLLEISLGIVTSVGGFLELGSLATSAQAGAGFGFQLLWAIVLGTICIIFLVEMAGRFAAVSHHTISDAIRERFGFNFFLLPFLVTIGVNFLVLAAEIGGVCISLEFATGVSFQWWAVPAALLIWVLLWKGTFGFIENGVSCLGLITLCLVVAAVLLQPDWREVATGAVPSLPDHAKAHYWFVAVSILGASISPYLFLFYSSGAIEDKWDESHLGVNRAVAGLGMTFGGTIAVGALVVAALVLRAHGIEQVDDYHQLPLMLTPVFGSCGFVLMCASLGIACLGAALEISLQQAYLVAQGFGWNWSKNARPKNNPGFSATYSLAVLVGAVPIAAGLDPLKLTTLAMALTAASLPLTVVPFLFLMNDERYVGEHRNGLIGNAAVLFVIGLGFVLAIITIPLEIFGS